MGIFRWFAKPKNGKCRFWQHDYRGEEKIEWFQGTGNYINGKEIQSKKFAYKSTCVKCGDVWIGDTFSAR